MLITEMMSMINAGNTKNIHCRVPDGAEIVASQSSGLELQLADRCVQTLISTLKQDFSKTHPGLVLTGRISSWKWP